MLDFVAGDSPFVEFIDDYFVECDEHLTVARNSLLALEPSVNQPHIDRPLLDELFRSFHSIKGLSAMVEVRAAEQLAHQMESYLSVLRKEQTKLTAEGLETLILGVNTLEGVIAARRGHTLPPDSAGVLARLEVLLPGAAVPESPADAPRSGETASPKPAELPAEKSQALARAISEGARAWRFTFAPSASLAERGVNVNKVRERLQEAGELIHAAPSVLPGGKIVFTFFVASRADESLFAPWQDDQITYTPYEPAVVGETLVRKGAEPPASTTTSATLSASNFVRVDLTRLDDLMRMVGDLVISRARLDDNLKHLGGTASAPEWRALHETNQAIERQLRDLREGVMRVRMVPVREMFARMQFVVRDLMRDYGKKVALTLNGQETEIDKLVVERMMDPLLHLVRNAVSHGLETPDERLAAGKPVEGKIGLRAGTTGEMIVIEIEDDGRGIDAQRVFERAKASGMINEQTVQDTAALLDILCAPGFSTREEVDRASGRGVGMAVVRAMVEELGGLLMLDTRLGQGTRFTIQLPLTLAIADALIVSAGGQTFAVPQIAVREVLQIAADVPKLMENNELIPYRESVLPLIRLTAFFRLEEQRRGTIYVLVLGVGLAAIGLVVERVLGLREIVVRPLTDPLVRVAGLVGATELGDGRVVLILDTIALGRVVRKQSRGERSPRTV